MIKLFLMSFTKTIKKTFGKLFRLSKIYLNLLKYYSFNKINNKTLIICFDGVVSHGGLVDRLIGIVSFYELSRILNYDFKVVHNSPFELSYFLAPNKVDWQLSNNKMGYNPLNTSVIYSMEYVDVNLLEKLKKNGKRRLIIYSNVDYLKHFHTNLSEYEYEKLWRSRFNELFKPSEVLYSCIKKFETDKRLVFHTRFTSLMGDFIDTTTKSLSSLKRQKLMSELVLRMNNIVDENEEVYSDIYVLSDSITFLNYIKENTNYKVLDGNPKHLEYIDDLDSHLKIFIDFYFIVLSDNVILLKLDKMYNSRFSKYAAIVGEANFNILDN